VLADIIPEGAPSETDLAWPPPSVLDGVGHSFLPSLERRLKKWFFGGAVVPETHKKGVVALARVRFKPPKAGRVSPWRANQRGG